MSDKVKIHSTLPGSGHRRDVRLELPLIITSTSSRQIHLRGRGLGWVKVMLSVNKTVMLEGHAMYVWSFGSRKYMREFNI